MTTPRDAFLLSPYRPPTSYPVSLDRAEAAAWLAGYVALWHPAVLGRLARPPQVASAYDHDHPSDGAVYVVAAGPHVQQPDDWPDRVREVHAVTATSTPDRAETNAALLAALRQAGEAGPRLDTPDETVGLFAAIGFGYLLVESLFDAMDHEHLLDADAFWTHVRSAVESVETGETGETGQNAVREELRAAAELLRAARETLNTSSVHLLDFVILDRERLGGPWPRTLSAGLPLTVLAAAELLERQADDHPERFAELTARLAGDVGGPVDFASGAYREREDAMFPPESQWWNLTRARAVVRERLGKEAEIYARHRSAYHPQLPGWLLDAGFQGAVMIGFDGALTPGRNAAVINWPGPDGKNIDAYGREPHPAADPLTFFNLAYHLQQSFGHDSAPTIALSHRGDPAAVGYDEFVTLADLGDVVGTFTNLRRYLEQHHYGEYLGGTSADDFFADYLDDRVTDLRRPDAVTGFARHHRLRRRLDGTFTLAALHRSIAAPTEDERTEVGRLEQLEREIETRGADTGTDPADDLSDRLAALETGFAERLAARVLARSESGRPGLVVFNPFGFTRRVALEVADFPGPIAVADPVKAAQFDGTTARLVVEVPGFGYAWVPRGGPDGTPPPKARIATADQTTVRNEFLEAELDPQTGALRALRDSRTRVNRLGMQLVYNPGSKFRATNVRVTLSGPAVGEVTADGDITDEHDKLLATFQHRVRAWVGRPAIEVSLTFVVKHPPRGYPWHAYYGARFGWRDERAALFRGVNGANMPSTYTRPVSPDYFEVRLGRERTFVFTGGLPFVQKHGTRMADVVLIPEGEGGRSFEMLLAVDRDYPMPTAVGWTAPAPVVVTDRGPPPSGPSGWLATVDLPSLLPTALRPEAGPTVTPGMRAVSGRFIECSGFGGTAGLRFARDPVEATLLNGDGHPTQVLGISDGMIPLEFSADEAFRVRASWL